MRWALLVLLLVALVALVAAGGQKEHRKGKDGRALDFKKAELKENRAKKCNGKKCNGKDTKKAVTETAAAMEPGEVAGRGKREAVPVDAKPSKKHKKVPAGYDGQRKKATKAAVAEPPREGAESIAAVVQDTKQAKRAKRSVNAEDPVSPKASKDKKLKDKKPKDKKPKDKKASEEINQVEPEVEDPLGTKALWANMQEQVVAHKRLEQLREQMMKDEQERDPATTSLTDALWANLQEQINLQNRLKELEAQMKQPKAQPATDAQSPILTDALREEERPREEEERAKQERLEKKRREEEERQKEQEKPREEERLKEEEEERLRSRTYSDHTATTNALWANVQEQVVAYERLKQLRHQMQTHQPERDPATTSLTDALWANLQEQVDVEMRMKELQAQQLAMAARSTALYRGPAGVNEEDVTVDDGDEV